MKRAFTIVLVGLVVAAPASAGTTVNKRVWVKASATWTKQANAHGAKAVCAPWGSASLTCDFGARGSVELSGRTDKCLYFVQVVYPAPRFPRRETVDLNYCAKRWWARPLPAPWR